MNTSKVLLITTLALLTTLNVTAYGSEITIKGIRYSYNDSTATVVWTVNPGDIKYKKSITIPETIKGYDKKKRIVTGIGWQAFKGYSIESIKLPKTIRNIDASAFENCSSLKSIGLPDGLQSIDYWAFKNCSSLKVITIPKGVRSIKYRTFEKCSSLESVGIPDGITHIDVGAFSECRMLKSVIVIHYDKKTSTNNKSNEKPHIGNSAFRDCSSLEYIDIPEGIESIESLAFYGCSKLKHVTFPNSLKNIGRAAFWNNKALSGIVLPDSLYYLDGGAFGSYTYNENHDLTHSDYHETLQIPQSVKQIENIQSSFSFTGKYYWDIQLNGSKLLYIKQDTPVVIPDFTVDNLDFKINDDKRSVTLVSSFFRQYNNPTISIPTSITYQGIDYLVTAIDKGTFVACPDIEKITLPDSLKSIGDFAFADCKHLTDIQFPHSLDSIGNSTFLRCTAIEEVRIPAQISKLSPHTFYGCTNLKYVNLNNINTIDEWAFYNCIQLKQVVGSEIEDIEDYAFDNCKRLTTIDLRLVKHIGNSAFYMTNLSTVALPNIKTLGEHAFVLCFSLKHVFLSEDLSVIPDGAFQYCNNLEYINIENIKEFGHNAFDGCDALWDYSIAEGAKVGKDAFKDCGKRLRDMIAEEARQKQIQEQKARQQIIEQQAEIERQNRQNAWMQLAAALGQLTNSLNQAINHNNSRSSVVTTSPTARTSASTPHTSTKSKSSNTSKKRNVSPHMTSLVHTYNAWISRLIQMNAQYERTYNDSDRIRYQKEARSVRQHAEQFDNCAVYKSSWEDWNGRRKR